MRKYIITSILLCFHLLCAAQYTEDGSEEAIENVEMSSGSHYPEEELDYAESELEGVEVDQKAIKEHADKLNYDESEEKTKNRPERLDDKPKERAEKKEMEKKRKGRSIWNGDTGKTLVYTMVFVLLAVILAFFIFNIRKKQAVAGPVEGLLPLNSREISEEMLISMDPDDALDKALRDKNLTAAVRILYLRNLKILMEKGLIRPAREKTNGDYVRELINPEYRLQLARLTVGFEAWWYGELPVDRSVFSKYREESDALFNQIRLGL